uniref:Glutathione synthetase n=1 Tax=Syphacia muris TaxID=451379 RepID=A0A0N5AEN1_9BILA
MSLIDQYPKLETISKTCLNNLVEDAVDWAHAVGMIMRTSEHVDTSDICQMAPFTLFPSPFPRFLFEQAMGVQEAMNLLYFRVSWDYDFLVAAHNDVAKTDEFTRNLVNIFKAVHGEGVHQKKTLVVQRSDYMCHTTETTMSLRQIEVNNIAVSMGGLSERVSTLHYRTLQDVGVSTKTLKRALPENKPIATIGKGLYEAWKGFDDSSALILFVVEPQNQNQFDQRYVEYEVDKLSERQVKCVRLTFSECGRRLTLGGSDNYSLMLDNTKRIAIVYFRAGYTPDHYASSTDWETRLLIERSNAIKCPWIGLHLANTKKVQQILTEDGQIERFIPEDSNACKMIRSTFARIWGLEKENKSTEAVIQHAITNPSGYVLKPQLEGGAGNYYGAEVAEKLRCLDADALAAHVLMERIYPKSVKNFLVRPMKGAELTNTIGELGIYGYLYGTGSFESQNLKVQSNYAHGHILRSKNEKEDKGGVAVGAAVIDSVFLY